ncbi:hypothetical protein [Lysinibacillus xylanilyticus]|uniref:hypothetical protein n=1 Tax=Lysinibacillus xylanilyticus TaxID=582475 RepID=UPI0036DB2F84
MAVVVNSELLRNFEGPMIANNSAYIAVLAAVKKCQDAIGEGTGIEEAIERNGIALEKTFNEEVVPAVQTTLQTLAASADNADEIKKVMAGFDAVNTSAVADVTVTQGVRHAAFRRG